MDIFFLTIWEIVLKENFLPITERQVSKDTCLQQQVTNRSVELTSVPA